jgi:hypothetical protein
MDPRLVAEVSIASAGAKERVTSLFKNLVLLVVASNCRLELSKVPHFCLLGINLSYAAVTDCQS